MMIERRRFNVGDVVRAEYPTDETPPRWTWYRAVVLGPAKRRGDYLVRVIEVGPGRPVAVGARLAPITGGGWDLAPG